MKSDKLLKILLSVSKGILIGIGVGAALFGILFLAISFRQDQSFNLGALIAVLAGSSCIFITLNYNSDQKQGLELNE